MKQAASLLVLWLLSGGRGSALQPLPQQAVIRGAVVDTDTNAPLPETRVILRKQREASQIQITSDLLGFPLRFAASADKVAGTRGDGTLNDQI